MPSEKYKMHLLKHAGLSKAWEAFPANQFSVNDLDHEEIILYRRDINNPKLKIIEKISRKKFLDEYSLV